MGFFDSGGGSSSLEGTLDIGEPVLDASVRLATPSGVGGLVDVLKNPEYAVGVGLLIYGYHEEQKHGAAWNSPFGRTGKKITDWVKDLF